MESVGRVAVEFVQGDLVVVAFRGARLASEHVTLSNTPRRVRCTLLFIFVHKYMPVSMPRKLLIPFLNLVYTYFIER